ncbi:MAG: DUF1573 domain-containing protein [Bacteroidales bacterium]|jgi:hypothetical protein|nr:DUF1573 domain-containing protein [Bacteroidales bacterium]
MKTFISANLVLILLLATSCGGKQGSRKGSSGSQPADTGRAVITFASYDHDFGKVSEGGKVGCIFTFQNTGTGSLLINNAVTSCGCTVPKYDNKPIEPGASGSIEVVFDTSGRSGIQTKSISVHSNASTPVVILQIKADVITNDAPPV